MQFTPALLQAIRELELRTRKGISSLLAGNYRSRYRGSGMQFKEFRHYEPGDDIRHMSWAVTARTGRATVKVFEEERELNVLLLLDVSGSSEFGFAQKRKIDLYAELTALLGLASVKEGDNFGLVFFSDKIEQFLPFRKTREHCLSGITQLLARPLHRKKSDLRPVLTQLHGTLKARSLILVVSDFLMPDFAETMRPLANKHEVILLRCYDDAERGFAMRGLYEAVDPETGEFFTIDANSPSTKKALSAYHTHLDHHLQQLVQGCGADYLPLSINDDYLKRLVHFFRMRSGARA